MLGYKHHFLPLAFSVSLVQSLLPQREKESRQTDKQTWSFILAILTVSRLRQKNYHEFEVTLSYIMLEASLGYRVRPFLKSKKWKKKKSMLLYLMYLLFDEIVLLTKINKIKRSGPLGPNLWSFPVCNQPFLPVPILKKMLCRDLKKIIFQKLKLFS